jgi:hypothetical protein
MHYKPCLSQNEHWLVPKCVLPLEVCKDSSFQHGRVGDARATCWGPSASEGPQKHDLTMFLEYDT